MHIIRKRFIIEGGIILLVGFVLVGVAGFALSVYNTIRINELQDLADTQQRFIDQLAQEVNITQLATEKLRQDFNLYVSEHSKNFTELKEKFPASSYVIASITSDLNLAKTVIKSAAREWKKRKAFPMLFDYLNITLPCGDTDCPLDHVTAQKCSLSPDLQSFYMEMYAPRINHKMHLVEADPFDLMLRTWNQTCRVVYNGPTTAVLASTGCPVALNIKTTRIYEMVYSPTETCLPDNQTTNAYFQIQTCRPRVPGDERAFVQVKSHYGFLHIYCPGSHVTIEGHKQECPFDVFVIPVGTRFTINDQVIVGSITTVHQHQLPDPTVTRCVYLPLYWHKPLYF